MLQVASYGKCRKTGEWELWWTLKLMRHSKLVRLETAPTGGESVYVFLEFTINERKEPNESVAVKPGTCSF